VAYSEWLAAALEAEQLASEQSLRKAFGFFDLDNSGAVSTHELQQILDRSPARAAVERWDNNGDKLLGKREFQDAMLRLAAAKAAK